MYIKELHKNYPDSALSYLPGDRELKFKAFSPLFENLYENKVIYNEKFMCLAKLEIVNLTSWGFKARATPLLEIERVDLSRKSFIPTKPWSFGGSWEFALLCGSSIVRLMPVGVSGQTLSR